MNSVCVVTKAKPFEEEVFVDVFDNKAIAEKILRKEVSPYFKKDGDHLTLLENGEVTLYFLHNKEVRSK